VHLERVLEQRARDAPGGGVVRALDLLDHDLDLARELAFVEGRVAHRIGQEFPIVTQDVRRALLEQFPYGAYYVEQATQRVEVIPVLHLMRQPESWRLRDR
jgi:hypothetical protein